MDLDRLIHYPGHTRAQRKRAKKRLRERLVRMATGPKADPHARRRPRMDVRSDVFLRRRRKGQGRLVTLTPQLSLTQRLLAMLKRKP